MTVSIDICSHFCRSLEDYRFHPAVLDAALQVGVHPLVTGAIGSGRYYLPSRLDTLVLHDALADGLSETLYTYAKVTRWTPGKIPVLCGM